MKQVWVSVAVPVELSGSVVVGQEADAALDGIPGRTFVGKVEQVAPAADPITRQVPVRVLLDNADLTIKPGMYARVNLVTQRVSRAVVVLPRGYYWSWGVNQQRRAEEFAGMTMTVLLAIGLIYMLLASQFESYVHPLTILLSVPLSAVGVILALFLTDRSFGLTAFIGLLMLVGIVVKNGILLVDYTNLLRQNGKPRDEAVLTAGPTRMRPILMTASAAVLGMMPISMALSRGSEIQAPMATAVIGGLITSTFLTLFVVPTV